MWKGAQVAEKISLASAADVGTVARDHHFRGDRPYADFRQLPMARDGALGSGCTAYVAETRSVTRSAPPVLNPAPRQAG